MELYISLLISFVVSVTFFTLFRFNTNILNIISVLTFFIPFAGPAAALVGVIGGPLWVLSKSHKEIENDIKCSNAALFVRDTKLNRWLFNTADELLFWKKTQMINENGIRDI